MGLPTCAYGLILRGDAHHLDRRLALAPARPLNTGLIMNLTRPAVTLLLLTLAGCAVEPILIPDRSASLATGADPIAVAELSGVRVTLNTAAWSGEPRDLALTMSPILISLENHSGRNLRIAYRDFAIVGANGFRYAALTLLPGQAPSGAAEPGALPDFRFVDYHPARPVTPRPLPPPRFHHHRFFVAPPYRHWYPNVFVWPHVFVYDGSAYDRSRWPVQLPTNDMLAEGLPEGVLEQGGSLSGFLFFQGVTQAERRVRLEMKLIDASTNDELGTLSVPLLVRR